MSERQVVTSCTGLGLKGLTLDGSKVTLQRAASTLFAKKKYPIDKKELSVLLSTS
jgi:hypothetical protein